MKVLIVEDEYYARQRLVKLLRECGEDLWLSAALENGCSAVEYLEQNPDVDVVVTDVIMPGLNGLQLAEYIHRNMPDVQVIIISGYEEFDYARKAMEYGVKQYLVKPVKKEQFLDSLRVLMEGRENRRREVEEKVQERLAGLHYGCPPAGQIPEGRRMMERYMSSIVSAVQKGDCCVAVLQLERAFMKEDMEPVHRICAQKLGDSARGIFCNRYNDEYVMVVSGVEQKNPEWITTVMEEILSYVHTRLQTGVTIGVSRPFKRMEQAGDAYEECLYIINSRLLKGWNRVYEYRCIRGEGGFFGQQDENMLTGALQLSDYEKAAGLIHGLLWKQELLESGDVNAYYDVILNILRTTNKYYRSACQEREGAEGRVEIMFSYRYDLYYFRHPQELEEYLLDIVQEICSREQGRTRSGGNAIIRDILHYVEHNYQYDLSLQELAEKKYFMNASYLSTLFKNEVGKTFSRYVIELRIKKAGELLEDRQLRINEIAAQVGYNNTSHFIQSFKKICGCTPEEQRSRMEQTEGEKGDHGSAAPQEQTSETGKEE